MGEPSLNVVASGRRRGLQTNWPPERWPEGCWVGQGSAWRARGQVGRGGQGGRAGPAWLSAAGRGCSWWAGDGKGHHCGVMRGSLRVAPPPGCVWEAWGRGPHGRSPVLAHPLAFLGLLLPSGLHLRPCAGQAALALRRPSLHAGLTQEGPEEGLGGSHQGPVPTAPPRFPTSRLVSARVSEPRGARGPWGQGPCQGVAFSDSAPPRGSGTPPSSRTSQRPWFSTGRTWPAGLALESNWADLRKAGNGEMKSPKCTWWHWPHAQWALSVLAALLSGGRVPGVLPRRGRSLPRAGACCSRKPRPD